MLMEIAHEVRPKRLSRTNAEVEALLLFCGVTPEQVGDSAGPPPKAQVAKTSRKSTRTASSSGKTPLGEDLKYRRDGDPLRVRGGLLLRREYEEGASIRTLSIKHKLAFGTVRQLLIEASTRLRGPGGSRGVRQELRTTRPG
jgi:hypothetical protein